MPSDAASRARRATFLIIVESIGQDAQTHGKGRQRLAAQHVLVVELCQTVETGRIGVVIVALCGRPVFHALPVRHQRLNPFMNQVYLYVVRAVVECRC